MRKLYALCLITLVAVLGDIVFFHSGTVSAQSAQVRVQQVTGDAGLNGGVLNVTGTVVGFACISNQVGSPPNGIPSCFIATSR